MIKQHPRTTADEEIALAPRARAGDMTARHRLVLGNLGLAGSLARATVRQWRSLDFDDACSEAVIGLQKAAEKYDPHETTPPKRFAAYARFWALRELGAYQSKMARVAAVPRTLKPSDVGAMLAISAPAVSLSAESSSGPARRSALAYRLASVEPTTATPSVTVLSDALRGRIAAMLPEERACLTAVFGLGSAPPRSPHAVARALGLSVASVQALVANALSWLRYDAAVRAAYREASDEPDALESLSVVLPAETLTHTPSQLALIA